MVPDCHAPVVTDPGLLSGKPVVKGTRLSVEFVLELLAAGWDETAIRENYPNRTPDGIRAAQSYAASSANGSSV